MNTLKSLDVRELRFTVAKIDQLRSLSRQIHRLDEAYCNGDLTPRQEKRKARLLQEAVEIAELLGLRIYHQSDPRGCSLYLIDETMGSTNYNDGIALY